MPSPFPRSHDNWCSVACARQLNSSTWWAIHMYMDQYRPQQPQPTTTFAYIHNITTSHTIKNNTQHTRLGRGLKHKPPTSPYGKTPVEKPLIGKNPPYILGEKPLTSTAQPHTTQNTSHKHSNSCMQPSLCQGSSVISQGICSCDKTHTMLPFGIK